MKLGKIVTNIMTKEPAKKLPARAKDYSDADLESEHARLSKKQDRTLIESATMGHLYFEKGKRERERKRNTTSTTAEAFRQHNEKRK